MIDRYITTLQNAIDEYNSSIGSSKIYADLSSELNNVVEQKVPLDPKINDNFSEISGVLNENQEKLIYYISQLAKYNVNHKDNLIYLDDNQIEYLKNIVESLRRFVNDSSLRRQDISYFNELIESLISNDLFDKFELLQESFSCLDIDEEEQTDIYFDLLKKNVMATKKDQEEIKRSRSLDINN
ncbi:MAG: hypothetical protein J5634_00040 [Bacilli bacterium]|nr:hypothetical protein [Bacilli bacterium]